MRESLPYDGYVRARPPVLVRSKLCMIGLQLGAHPSTVRAPRGQVGGSASGTKILRAASSLGYAGTRAPIRAPCRETQPPCFYEGDSGRRTPRSGSTSIQTTRVGKD